MDRFDNRLTTVLMAMVLGMTILSCLCYVTIFVQPNIPFNPLSPNRATIVAETALAAQISSVPGPIFATPDQSYPPTWTTTPTNTPGPTKTPTDTRTPTPSRTATPTPTPTPTKTFTPTPIPPPPTATRTPTPFPYFVSSHSSENNCADIGLKGVVNDIDGLPKSSVQIQYGEVGVAGSRFTASSDAGGRYGALLLPGSNKSAAKESHTWYAYVVENGQQASDEFKFITDPIYADNPSYCDDILEEEEDPDEAEKEFLKKGCILDPCKSSDSIQIKIINWQLRQVDN
ncbi:MAG: hypothetical protein AB1801_13180 [Chloroflexota bacterium]